MKDRVILEDLGIESCGWLSNRGPLFEVAISSRIRLARNLAGIPFAHHAPADDLARVDQLVCGVFANGDRKEVMEFVQLDNLSDLDRVFLSERHLISRDMVEGGRHRAVGISSDQSLSVMINEEDHIRIHGLAAGLDLSRVFERVNDLDNDVEKTLDFAFHPRWGYLTACPTNVGTGIRCSVMMHLPGLVIARQMERILSGVQEMGLAVRGGQGEGSEAVGSIFQISNQATLGIKEQETVDLMEREARKIGRFESECREQLMTESPAMVEDKVFRALGTLREARMLSSKELTEHLSAIRLGVAMGVATSLSYLDINDLLVSARPAHLQKRLGSTLDSVERDIARGNLVRSRLAQTT